MELCSILRISINEFLAGEDIGTENVIEKSDSNLIQITKESKKKQKNLKTILAVVTVFAVIVSAILGTLFFHKLIHPKNYITAVDQTSTEMKTAELLSGTDGAYLFHYFTKDEFKTLTIYVSEYQSGTLISKSKVADLDYDGIDSPSRGVIAVVPDFESFKVKLIVADDYAKYSTDFPILENIENREYYVRSASQIKGEIPIQIHSASTIEGKTAILSDSEQGLMALIYGKDGLSGIPITEMEKGIVGVENDYVYYLSFQFGGVIKVFEGMSQADSQGVVFMDAIHYHVRSEGRIVKRAVYIALGIDMSGKKDVLGMYVGENESAKFWLSIMNGLKNRGVEDILIACVDGLNGFPQAIEAVYPKTEIQQCIIHQIRNSTKFVSYKDIKKLMADLKLVYAAPTEETALNELELFKDKWDSKYPKIYKSWNDNWATLSTYFKYPEAVRRLIYTTNAIEGFNRQLRKVTKSKTVFPSDDSLLKMLYLATMDITKKWTGHRQDWGQIHSQLEIYFEERLAGRNL